MDPLSISSSVLYVHRLGAVLAQVLRALNHGGDRYAFVQLGIQIERVNTTLEVLKSLSTDRYNSDRIQDWSLIKRLLQSQDDVLFRITRDINEALFLVQKTGRQNSLLFLIGLKSIRGKLREIGTRLERDEVLLRSYITVASVSMQVLLSHYSN